MIIFLAIFISLLALNALLLVFSSSRRSLARKASVAPGPKPAEAETVRLGSFDPDYQEAV